MLFKSSIFCKKFLIFNNLFQIICNWCFFVFANFSHRLLFNWSLNWLFFNDRSIVLNSWLFFNNWLLYWSRFFNRSRFRICGFLFMVISLPTM